MINENSIISYFYFGGAHDHFKLKDGLIGACKNSGYPYWGCTFKEIIINNESLSLENEDGKYYQIYFATETNQLKFPMNFIHSFNIFTKDNFEYDSLEDILFCNLFNEEGYIPVKLINENKKITAEIDSVVRFPYNNLQANRTRIKFYDIDYIVLPLTMFKQNFIYNLIQLIIL